MLTAVSSQEDTKERAGRYAAGYVVDGMRVGLGTGSTVHWTIVELAGRGLDIVCAAYASAGAGGDFVRVPFEGSRDHTPLQLWRGSRSSGANASRHIT